MATTIADQQATYPLPAYNYRVAVLDGGGPIHIGCSEVSGLTVEFRPVTYKHGLSFALGSNIIPGQREPLRVTLKKGQTRRGDYLQKWLEQTYADPFGGSTKRDITIDLCDESANPLIRWTLGRALPIKLETSAFSASTQEVVIATMELVAHDLKVEYTTTG